MRKTIQEQGRIKSISEGNHHDLLAIEEEKKKRTAEFEKARQGDALFFAIFALHRSIWVIEFVVCHDKCFYMVWFSIIDLQDNILQYTAELERARKKLDDLGDVKVRVVIGCEFADDKVSPRATIPWD